MGAIPEYSRKQLASTYIGAAQRDDSAALSAEAIRTEAVEPPLKRALTEERAKKDAYTKMIANDSIIKYGLDAQTQLIEAQKTYANDPKKYPQEAQRIMGTLAEDYRKAIPDEDVAIEFMNAAGTMQRAAIGSSLSWSVQKQEDNALVALNDSAALISRNASTHGTADQFSADLTALYDTVHVTPGSTISEKDKQTLYVKAEKDAWEAYASNRLNTDPFIFAKELKNKLYNNFKYMVENDDGSVTERALSLEGTDISKYIPLAENAAALSDVRRAQNKLYADVGALSVLAEKYHAGDASLKDIATTNAAVQNDPEATAEIKEYSSALLKVATSKHTQTAVDNPVVIDRIQMKAAAIEQKKTTTKAKDMITEILKLKADIENEAGAGNITNGTAGILRKLVEPTYLGVLKQEGKIPWFGAQDPYTGQYARVIDRVKRMNLSGDRYLEAKVWAFSKFAEQVYEAEQKGRTVSNADLEGFIDTVIRSTQGQMFPGAYKYKVGDNYPTKYGAFPVIGYNDDGDEIVDMPPDVEAMLRAAK
jgi:hypothetical protein